MPAAGGRRAGKAAPRPRGRVGVVDIGSNSIRLVVFSRLARSPFTLFNEKALCGLGRGLDNSGKLHEAGFAAALTSIGRFVALARAMDVERLDLLATAAVRDAANGPAFVAEVRRRFGVRVRVLSGAEEAKLSARGVLSGMPEADGVMGDLGGGSLELVALDGGRMGDHATLPLGPIRLNDSVMGDVEAARAVIDRHLEKLDWLAAARGRDFYPVGGAWRTLARLHMEQHRYPLHVIQHYVIARPEAEDFARMLSRQGRRSLSPMQKLSRRRLEALPFAALLLERLLRLARPRRIVFSAFGLREGHLHALLPAAERVKDPLISACAEFAAAEGRFGERGRMMQAWLEPLFAADDAAARRLRLAACILGDVGWRDHPDYRAEQAFTRILRLPVAGIDHAGRVALALAVFVRYGGEIEGVPMPAVLAKLEAPAPEHWRRVGLALRAAYALTAATPEILARTAVALGDKTLILRLAAGDDQLVGETVNRRFDQLAASFGRASEIVVAPAAPRGRRSRDR